MAMPVQQPLAGFIASDGDVPFTNAGISRVRFLVGVQHGRRKKDGTFARLDNSFHDLVIFGRTADRAADLFREGGRFVAHGYVESRYAEPSAPPAERAVDVARCIGRDLARTIYDVSRTPTTTRQGGALATIGAESGQPTAEAEKSARPTAPPIADRPASLRPGGSLGHGIGR